MNIIDRLPMQGRFGFRVFRKGALLWEAEAPNIIVNEGRNYILSSALGAGAQLVSFFLAPFTTNYTPVLADTAATIPGNSGEQTNYAEATRVAWVPVTAGQIITNSASPASFTFAGLGGPTLIYGLFLVSVSGKGATTGTLIGAARFSTARTVENGDIGLGVYGINAN